MNSVKTTAEIILAASMVAAVGLELHAARISVFVVLLSLWVASPFVLMIWATRSRGLARWSDWTLLGGSLLLALSTLHAYRPAEIASRSTAALSFAFLPLYQNIGVAVLVGASAVLSRKDRRTSR